MKKPVLYALGAIVLIVPLILAYIQGSQHKTSSTTEPSAGQEQASVTEASSVNNEASLGELGAAVRAVDLIDAWISSGASESAAFDYTGADGNTYQATYEADVLPLFTGANVWYEGSQACSGCHFGNNETSYHEMDLTSHEGLLKGGDVLSDPPGMPILGQSEVGATDFDFGASKLRERLRNNRMAPGVAFDITEGNRDGPVILAGMKK